MRPMEIKARLKAKGLTQGDLSRKWKKSRSTVSFLVNRKMTSAELERKLAEILDVAVAELRDGKK